VPRPPRPLAALPPALSAVLAAAAAFSVSPRAEAYEHQWHLGGSFGYTALWGGPTASGFGGGIHAAYGVNDAINIIGEIDATDHPYAQWAVLSGGLGASYVVDVLQWVPWAGLEVGPAALFSTDPKCGLAVVEPCHALRFNVAIPFGLDYQVSRSFAVGLGGRFQLILLGDEPWMTLGIFARAEYLWGY
jgi:hypothetical protein